MEGAIAVTMIGVMVGVVLAILLVVHHLEKKRSAALQAQAQGMNFTFEAKPDQGLLGALGGFHLFSQGHSKKVFNLMEGRSQDIDLRIFDYTYTVGGGKNSQTFKQTVALFQSDPLRLPGFALRPEHFFHKIGSAFGFKDIDFDEHPQFSSKYLLRGADEDAIRALFDDQIMGYYEAHEGLSTEGERDVLLFYRQSKRPKPEELHTFMEDGFAVFAIFKGRAGPRV